MKFKRDIIVALSTVAVIFLLHRVFVTDISDKGVKLEENASKFYEIANEYKEKAEKISVQTKKLEEKIKAKDQELNNLYSKSATSVVMAETIQKQKEAIELRDFSITALKAENKELRLAMSNAMASYETQQMATRAYKEAMAQAQWKAGFKGVAIGAALGWLIRK